MRGAPVIRGYLNRPDATAEAIVDGWLRTGDLGEDRRGRLRLHRRSQEGHGPARRRERVLRRGRDRHLFEHDAVAECVVFGVPDDRLGEEVGACVVVEPGATLTAEDLRAHCAERIARHKVPRYIWLQTESLPRNANGKFLKRELARGAAARRGGLSRAACSLRSTLLHCMESVLRCNIAQYAPIPPVRRTDAIIDPAQARTGHGPGHLLRRVARGRPGP
ncbi:MAG: AMP-binding protein [Gammaproteobacteria bacterium]|nr:AMP-binding protein [Gammaproteobacteria bacterium]